LNNWEFFWLVINYSLELNEVELLYVSHYLGAYYGVMMRRIDQLRSERVRGSRCMKFWDF